LKVDRQASIEEGRKAGEQAGRQASRKRGSRKEETGRGKSRREYRLEDAGTRHHKHKRYSLVRYLVPSKHTHL
jgi:hypothetical protein